MQLTIIGGAGKMGEAMARGILASQRITPAELMIADAAAPHLLELADTLGVRATRDNIEAVREADIVILAVKPYLVSEVCAEIATAVPAGSIILSIAAGVTLQQIHTAMWRDDLLLARTMPNTPTLVGAGAFGLAFDHDVPDDARDRIRQLLTPLGVVAEVPETQLDAVTGLSGSGPAYVAIFIEALTDGAVQMGLPRAQAHRLAVQTVLGTAQLIQQGEQHPALVKDAVTSPGGTTIAGIAALEEAGFRHAVMAAVRAATRRACELSGE